MIVIRVELHSAITGKVKEIGRVVIDNIGGTRTRGNYRCRAYRAGSRLTAGLEKNVIRRGAVADHARLAEPVWNLVAKALEAMGYGAKEQSKSSEREAA